MTTQEDRQLGRRIPKSGKGPMILRNGGMLQYAIRKGQPLNQKVNEACGRFDALRERGMP